MGRKRMMLGGGLVGNERGKGRHSQSLRVLKPEPSVASTCLSAVSVETDLILHVCSSEGCQG